MQKEAKRETATHFNSINSGHILWKFDIGFMLLEAKRSW
jgi:hypothetical protein